MRMQGQQDMLDCGKDKTNPITPYRPSCPCTECEEELSQGLERLSLAHVLEELGVREEASEAGNLETEGGRLEAVRERRVCGHGIRKNVAVRR